jgi:hypothetical protein
MEDCRLDGKRKDCGPVGGRVGGRGMRASGGVEMAKGLGRGSFTGGHGGQEDKTTVSNRC